MANASGGATEHFYLSLSSSAERDIYCDLNMQSWKTCEHTSAQNLSVDIRLLLNQSVLRRLHCRFVDRTRETQEEEISAPQTRGIWPLMILTCFWPSHGFNISKTTSSVRQKNRVSLTNRCLTPKHRQPIMTFNICDNTVLDDGTKWSAGCAARYKAIIWWA